MLSGPWWNPILVPLLLALAGLAACKPESGNVSVAVAANFSEPAREIATLFERNTGNRVLLSSGSTGQLLTQITQDAPFEVFLAADQESPRKTLAEGFATRDSQFTYATGRIVLFSRSLDLTDGAAVLRRGQFGKLAIANPAAAPYGAAAVEALRSLGLYEQVRPKFVQGNNIAQTFQFVDTLNAEIGFVARSQVIGKDKRSVWVVPDSLYSPLRQDAILLKRGTGNEAARRFLDFLRSPEATSVIEKFGYSHTG